MPAVLMVLTGARTWMLNDGTAHPTGFWAEEFVVPHRIFTKAGVDVTLATPGGVAPAVDELSLSLVMNADDETKIAELREYLHEAQPVLEAPLPLEDVDALQYDAVFIPGGHGPMQDLSANPDVARVLTTLLDAPGKLVASLCHGPASFLPAQRPDGTSVFAGRRLTAFTDEEETQPGFASRAPWLLEDRLRAKGVTFDSGPAWSSHVVVDGNLITGQNPASAGAAAEAVLDALRISHQGLFASRPRMPTGR